MTTQPRKSHPGIFLLLAIIINSIAHCISHYASFLAFALVSIMVAIYGIHACNAIQKRKGENRMVMLEVAFFFLILMIAAAIFIGPIVPKWKDAEVRAKVSRTKSNFRTMSTVFESYYREHNRLPDKLLPDLTTPIAYLTADVTLIDPFTNEMLYYFHGTDDWLLIGVGPDGLLSLGPKNDTITSQTIQTWPIKYDPTNGLRSKGDIFRYYSETSGKN